MKRIIVIGIGLLTILGLVTIPLLTGETEAEDTMEREYQVPPVDAGRPAVTKTATFALG